MTSIASGSALVTSFPPPACRYNSYREETTVVPVEPDPDADPEAPLPPPAIQTENVPTIRDDGSYRYVEFPVDSSITNQDVADDVADRLESGNDYSRGLAQAIAISYTPLEEARRRFRIGCVPDAGDTLAQTAIEFSLYPAFIDIGPDDPLFDVRGQIADLYNSLQLTRPRPQPPASVDTWGGLVVRSPAWLSIDADAWRVHTSDTVDHLGWQLQLLAVPSTLHFTVDFQPSDADAQHLAVSGLTVDCLGDATTESLGTGGARVPAQPADLPDWSEPGVGGSCRWTPPARGTATVTAHVTYGITFLASGYGTALPDYEWSSDPSPTFTVGELRAVNTND
ncbi:hypothetical protein [Ilumatobacter sp.]|uniref:hypothetical protein n=1 Tax=Ilumatobacter sp. TaxID=1967498 RepID=UPI003B52AD3C